MFPWRTSLLVLADDLCETVWTFREGLSRQASPAGAGLAVGESPVHFDSGIDSIQTFYSMRSVSHLTVGPPPPQEPSL